MSPVGSLGDTGTLYDLEGGPSFPPTPGEGVDAAAAAAFGYVWDPSSSLWVPAQSVAGRLASKIYIGSGAAGDGIGAIAGIPRSTDGADVALTVAPTLFTGSGQDRWRGDIANGADVDVTRSALPTGAATEASLVTRATEATLAAILTRQWPALTRGQVNGTANAATTLTLAAPGAGLYHYITHVHIARHATAALAASAALQITTTNLTGSNAWRVTNGMAAWERKVDVDIEFVHPWRSVLANTATTFDLPAAGAAVLWSILVHYFTAT